ncbi:hypothetical protein Pcinc_041276, partial [Petrolisthes cinctipes]
VLKDKKEGLVVKPVKLNANPTHDPKFDPTHYTPRKHSIEQELIPVCSNELEFYEYLQTSMDPQDVALKSLLPQYHGSRLITTDDGKVTPHLLLGDLARGMKKPCVADIKMGRSFTYPGKDFTKQINKKYVTRDELGYCLSGLRVFDPNTGALVVELRPDACKQLTRSQVFHSLEMFCQRGHPAGRHLRDSVVSQLRQIHQWFLSQKKYWVRCSSILVIYDAATLTTKHSGSEVIPDAPVTLTTKHSGSEVIPDAPVTLTTKHSDSEVIPDAPVTLTTKHSGSEVIPDAAVPLTTKHSDSEVIPTPPVPLINQHSGSEVIPDAPVTLTTQHSDSEVIPTPPVPLIDQHSESKVKNNVPITSESVTQEATQDTARTTKPHTTSEPPHSVPAIVSAKPRPSITRNAENTPDEPQTSINTPDINTTTTTPSFNSQNIPDKKPGVVDSIGVKVKMIDFAHVLYSFGERDDNYIFGLDKLVEFFNASDSDKNSQGCNWSH